MRQHIGRLGRRYLKPNGIKTRTRLDQKLLVFKLKEYKLNFISSSRRSYSFLAPFKTKPKLKISNNQKTNKYYYIFLGCLLGIPLAISLYNILSSPNKQIFSPIHSLNLALFKKILKYGVFTNKDLIQDIIPPLLSELFEYPKLVKLIDGLLVDLFRREDFINMVNSETQQFVIYFLESASGQNKLAEIIGTYVMNNESVRTIITKELLRYIDYDIQM